MTSPQVTAITRADLPGTRVREGRSNIQSAPVLPTFRAVFAGGSPKSPRRLYVFSRGHSLQAVVPADLCVRPMVLRHVVAPVLWVQP